jgi:hypothetical protein
VAVVILRSRRPQETVVEAPAAAVEAPRPLGGDARPVAVPPLEESDPFVRELVRRLTSHPRLLAWLATDGLVRNFTTVVVNIADGQPFAGQLSTLRPPPGFAVMERGDDLYIDPRSYDRYTAIAEGVAGIDPAGAADVYGTLKPRIEEAYRELGQPDGSFDRALERAIVELVRTPIPREPIRVEPHGIGYAFADERIEGLKPAQKQLLRMGPDNARRIQASLRAIGIALGIPPERLTP